MPTYATSGNSWTSSSVVFCAPLLPVTIPTLKKDPIMDIVTELRTRLLTIAKAAACGTAHYNGTDAAIHDTNGKYIGGWSRTFRCTEIDSVVKNQTDSIWSKKNPTYSIEELATVPIEDLVNLGFFRWTKTSQLLLLPLWVWHYVKDGETLYSIMGETVIKNDMLSLDDRNGLVAYGFQHPQLVIQN